jgi:phage terminase large subunit-like protein
MEEQAEMAKPLIVTPVPAADVRRGDGELVDAFIGGTAAKDYQDGFCRVTKESFGGHAGELLRVRPWQSQISGCVYARRPDMRYKHREALIGLPRKNGKSAIGSSYGLNGLVASDLGAEVYCLDPAVRVLCDDLTWRPCGDLREGDGIIGFDEEPDYANCRRYRSAQVTSADRIGQPCFEIRFSDGRKVIASTGHRWLGRRYQSSNRQDWIKTEDLVPGMRIRDLGQPWVTDESREAGYLAGLYDGEGCIVGAGARGGTYRRGAVVGFAQKPGLVQDRFESAMKDRGYDLKIRCQNSGVMESKITGTYECLKLLGTLRPSRLLEKVPHWIDGIAANRGSSWIEVTSVRPRGVNEVVAIGTSAQTLFAEGFFSHNSCAADKEQARIVFGVAKRMVELDPQLSDIIKPYRDALEYTQRGSVYKVLSSEAFTKEGLNPSVIIYDELHAAPTDELYNVMSMAQGSRFNPLFIIITTAGTKSDSSGQDSICYRRYQYGCKVAKGEVNDPSFFMVWYGASEGADYKDPKVWEAANPGFGDLLDPEDFTSVLGKVHENEFRTKRLNQWVSQARAWLPQGAWAACKDTDRSFSPGGKGVVLGFDGSKSGDCTALVAVTVDAEPVIRVLNLWEKPERAADWKVPRGQVKDAIRDACRTYKVREIAWDEYLWLDSAEELEDEGLPVVIFPQTLQRMGPATQRFYEMVNSKKITHDGDPRLERHLENAQLKTDSRGSRLQKDARNSPRKIDLAVASVMALDRAAFYLTKPGADEYSWEDAYGEKHSMPVGEMQFVW